MERINITFPAWIDRLPKNDQPRARMRFILKLAAVLGTREGSVPVLSKRIGMHKNSLNAMLVKGSLDSGIPVNMIKAIEQVIGVGVIPRSMMNPDVYGDQ